MDITLREIYDGFAETYEENRGLFDMTDVFASFYECQEVKKGSTKALKNCTLN